MCAVCSNNVCSDISVQCDILINNKTANKQTLRPRPTHSAFNSFLNVLLHIEIYINICICTVAPLIYIQCTYIADAHKYYLSMDI